MGNVHNMVIGGGVGIKLASITITTPPTKINYLIGESFDPAGMVVTATYSNGAQLIVTDYNTSPASFTAPGEQNVTVSYTETGVTVSASVTVSLLSDNFADNTWEDIIAACQSGSVPDSWAVGSSKVMDIDGTSYQVDIIGKNHDDYADGSGKAPLTFQMHNLLASLYSMCDVTALGNNWESCAIRSTCLPDTFATMPTAVQGAIREVSKKTSKGNQSTTINTTADKLFLLSEVEVFGSVTNSVAGEGSQYAYYAEGRSKIKVMYGAGRIIAWWTRSPHGSSFNGYCTVSSTGAGIADGFRPLGCTFAFCF